MTAERRRVELRIQSSYRVFAESLSGRVADELCALAPGEIIDLVVQGVEFAAGWNQWVPDGDNGKPARGYTAGEFWARAADGGFTRMAHSSPAKAHETAQRRYAAELVAMGAARHAVQTEALRAKESCEDAGEKSPDNLGVNL